VRITGGNFRGRTLFEPADTRVRPTSDKVRQAIFNILAHHAFEGFALDGAKVVDLFAGTGALGIEALSRGGAFALFIDDSAESRALVRKNVEVLGLTGVTKIWRRDAAALGPLGAGAGGPFNLAFLDAPYRKGLTQRALAGLLAGGWMAPHALIVAETAANEHVAAPPELALLDARNHGDTAIHTYGVSPG
jgi:16S rRNA (guanine966-N2)-methyltransferase